MKPFKTNAAGVLLFLSCLCAPAVKSQEVITNRLRVFVDCQNLRCDFDFFRREIAVVDYVRDRQDADVHVLITSQTTGGGRAITLDFIGLRTFAGLDDHLVYNTSRTDTDDEDRRGITKTLKLGLIRYIGRTNLRNQVSVDFSVPDTTAPPAAESADRWNNWVFRTRLNGFGSGEDRFKSFNFNGSVSAQRVTEEWKLNYSVGGNRSVQKFEFTDGTTETNIQSSASVSALVVKSLGEHWSTGIISRASRSTRSNFDFRFSFAPALEYNIFPYSESTRREMKFLYELSINYFDYNEVTIFDRATETRLRQSLEGEIEFRQPWGSVDLFVEGANYFHDPSKLSVDVGGSVELRVIRGLSLEVGGNVELVRDQLNIAKGDATDEDVLLQRRELETNYRFFGHFGVSYTFGSIFNNVVNPRF